MELQAETKLLLTVLQVKRENHGREYELESSKTNEH